MRLRLFSHEQRVKFSIDRKIKIDMSKGISEEVILSFKTELENHPVYGMVSTIADLRCFMEHHIYSVWDFMSLIKYLQSKVTPVVWPWSPVGDAGVRRFINELVLEEESDKGLPNEYGEETFSSHFELYIAAMREVGADCDTPLKFLERVKKDGLHQALANESIPEPSKRFTKTTFEFIETGKPHVVAAALALGREHIIPRMFRSFLSKKGVSKQQAPTFHYYLERHIQLDEDFHAPLSLRLLNELCDNEDQHIQEAIAAAQKAVQARIAFWDGVVSTIRQNRLTVRYT